MTTTESNPQTARSATLEHLVRDEKGVCLMYIGGDWCAASDGATRAMVDPGTGETIAHVAEATVEDTERAIAIARKAFDEGAVARNWRARASSSAHRIGAAHRGKRRRPRAARDAILREAGARNRVRRYRRRELLPLLRGARDQAAWRDVRRAGRVADVRRARTGRRVRSGHPLELSAAHGGLEDGAGARGGERPRPQTVRIDAADRAVAGAH